MRKLPIKIKRGLENGADNHARNHQHLTANMAKYHYIKGVTDCLILLGVYKVPPEWKDKY